MTSIIKKARKGNKEAFISLYESNKDQVYLLCKFLLDDQNSLPNAVSRIFRNMWDILLDGQIEDEEDFRAKTIDRAVKYCKVSITKNDPKAFHIPINKNFVVTAPGGSRKKEEKDPIMFIIRNLPPLHRFIYVANALVGYDDVKLAGLFMTNIDTVRYALESEDGNVRRLHSYCERPAGGNIINCEEFIRRIVQSELSVNVPAAVDDAVAISIESICAPIDSEEKKKSEKRSIVIGATLASLFMLFLLFCGIMAGLEEQAENTGGSTDSTASYLEEVTYTSDYTATHYADIAIEGYGTITVALDGNKAPETVENFVSLASSGFYDGLTFHRIVEGFVMQCGDPDGNGYGSHKDEEGNEINITGEFYYNGSDNNLSHTRGAISMARGNDYNSASSQFFIVHQETYIDSLDGLYAVFGYVIDGMDIVDAICEASYTIDENEVIAAEEQPVITSITIRSAETNEETETEETENSTAETNENGDAIR